MSKDNPELEKLAKEHSGLRYENGALVFTSSNPPQCTGDACTKRKLSFDNILAKNPVSKKPKKESKKT